MKVGHLSEVPVDAVRSPSGRYQLTRLLLSQHLGAPKDAPPSKGGHPFEVEICRILPGAWNWPLHAHSTQWEFFVVQSGEGIVETTEGQTPIRAGDFFMQPPMQAHHIRNTGTADLELLIVANNSEADIVQYPRSGRFFIKPQRIMGYLQPVDFYEGEDEE
ncbi:MAG: cupin domain-containing protein [Verrucomicrobiota bacterium JB022]|nr:cupin domain-containing protein [Verrucomicrobiota bacterium JB022]